MTRKKRANQKHEDRSVLYSRPELPDHIEVEPNQVSVNYATQSRPVSKRNGRNIQAVVAGEVGSVNTDLQTHQTSSFFPSSTGFEVSGGNFSSYRDHHSTGNVFINVNRPGPNGSLVEVREPVPARRIPAQKEHNSCNSISQQVPGFDIQRSPQHIPHTLSISEQHDGNWVTEHPDPQLVNRTPPRSSPPPLPVQKSSEIYYRHLLTSGHGSPLWIPEPSNTLPIEYQRAGIGIGDAIILTDSGGTDFLFNIYHPKGDSEYSINLPTMPEGYHPLDRPHTRDVNTHVEFKHNSFLASSLVNSRRDEESPGLIFESSAMDGAILTMPNGANSTDLKNKTIFRRYVRINAERWYKYANEVCGRDARNGDIRLVVGKTSTTTWGMATFANRSEQSAFRLKFKPTRNVGNGVGPATYGWEYSGIAEVKSGPDSHEVEKLKGDDSDGVDAYENQCLFVRTINVTLQDDVWDKLMMEWERLDLYEDEASSGSNSDSGMGSPSSRLSFGSSSLGESSGSSSMSSSGGTRDSRAGSGGTTRGASIPLTDSHGALLPPSRRRNRPRRSVHLSSFPPPNGLHPSKIINRFLLRERPHVKMVITEDDDWISLLDKSDEVFPPPNVLLSRMMAAYDIHDEEDVVFLKARELPYIPMIPYSLVMKTSEIGSQGRDLRRYRDPKSPWPWGDQVQRQDHPKRLSVSEMYQESKDSEETLRSSPPEHWRPMCVATQPEREASAMLVEFLRSSQFPSEALSWEGYEDLDSGEMKRLVKLISNLKFAVDDVTGINAGELKTYNMAGVDGKMRSLEEIKLIVPVVDGSGKLTSLKKISLGGAASGGFARYRDSKCTQDVDTPFFSLLFDTDLRLRPQSGGYDRLDKWYLQPDLARNGTGMKYGIRVIPRPLADGTRGRFVAVSDVLDALTHTKILTATQEQNEDHLKEKSRPTSLPFSIQDLPHEWEQWAVRDKVILDESGNRYVMD